MFIRLNLLRHQSKSSIKWSRIVSESNKSNTNLTLVQRHCSDIKRNEELLFSSHGVGVVIPSPLKIKQTIKTGFHDFVDGVTCIQTACPICPSTIDSTVSAPSGKASDQSKKDDKCLFINKTTGNLKI